MRETFVSAWCSARRWAFNGPEPAVPACDHQACADDIERHRNGTNTEESIWACPAGRCHLAWLEAECELPAGHSGDHEYEPRSDPATWSDVDLGSGHPWPNGPLPAPPLAERGGAGS